MCGNGLRCNNANIVIEASYESEDSRLQKTMLRVGRIARHLTSAVEEGDPVQYKVGTDGVALLTLNRPARLNAWTSRMASQYFARLRDADADPAVKAIVITGAGRGFCAGADMGSLQAIEKKTAESAAAEEQAEERASQPRPLPVSLQRLSEVGRNDAQIMALQVRKPMIGAINGACAGLGLVIACMCDVRFAAENAKFTTAFARRGLVAEHGCSVLLPRIVGHANALDLLLSARVVQGAEALALGLVNGTAPDGTAALARALAYARDLAAHVSPASMAAIKCQMLAHADLGFAAACDETQQLMDASFRHPDFKEGVDSFTGKRLPEFQGLAAGTIHGILAIKQAEEL